LLSVSWKRQCKQGRKNGIQGDKAAVYSSGRSGFMFLFAAMTAHDARPPLTLRQLVEKKCIRAKPYRWVLNNKLIFHLLVSCKKIIIEKACNY